MTNKKRTTDYHEYLIGSLQNPKEAEAYLNAALTDEDPRIFLLALRNVLEAYGIPMTDFAKKTHLNRESLYRMLSKKGNPKLMSIKTVLDTIGFNLAVQRK